MNKLEEQIISLINDIQPISMTIPSIGSLSAAIIYTEYGDINKFNSPSTMLSFSGLEPGYYQSGISEHDRHMLKHESSNLRYTLMNLCIPLIQYNMVFVEFYTKKHNEGKSHRVACSHVIKKLIRIIYQLEKENIDFDSSKLR